MDLGFEGVHVLVTGASGGIGLAITKLFLEHGARVSAQYNSKPGPLDNIKTSNDRLHVIQADVTEEKAVTDLFLAAGEAWKQEAQVLILNHGIFTAEDVDLVDMELSQWDRCLSVNLTGSFLVARQFLRQLRRSRAGCGPDLSKVAIVIIGSSSGEFGEESHIDYAVTKSALQTGFLSTLKHEIIKIAPNGRVNSVAPGWVNTVMAKPLFSDPDLLRRTLAATPLRRIAEPEDIATQVLILASSKASAHVTGTNISMAGGQEGRIPPDPEDYVALKSGMK
ncbi:hypothetical protein RSOLAG1IB_07299 [Rhizoctonia solani AG-1 IB]|uniref:NAD(P)-binding protein n=1 Tax=Thanatephorus cucumeris (strain AG1-IB / isolate 7/3/14) TaxID=1108050 RepID=A0A0B7FB43_THACB|nr:hypothetical protein RSOLAG1IB_07299 [Rhizoctonia solani AG-1 IB]